jgi:hypothetical protein
MALRAVRIFQLLGQRQQQAGFATSEIVTKFDWKAVKIPDATTKDIPTISAIIPTCTGGASFPGDIRGTSGLGKGDGCKDHTSKWLMVRACFMGASAFLDLLEWFSNLGQSVCL